jgi:hypothetical protein
VTDCSDRLVASGEGANISEATEVAMASTEIGDAREHLRQIKLPEAPFAWHGYVDTIANERVAEKSLRSTPS